MLPPLQLVVNGLIAGSLYALVAAGFSLVYATNRFVHLAHGATVAVSAYTLFALSEIVRIPFPAAVLLTVLGAGGIGLLIHRGVYQPLRTRGASSAILLIASIGLGILLENLLLTVFGPQVRTLSILEVRQGLVLGPVVATPLQLAIIGSAAALLAGLAFFSRRSRLGVRLRAVADHPELAAITGINVPCVYAWSLVLGSALGGLAATFIALEQSVEPHMGTTLIIKAFTGAVIGGATSLPGAVFGSYLLGVAENIGIWWLPSGWKDAIAFLLLFVFLLVRPAGLLGIRKGVRE